MADAEAMLGYIVQWVHSGKPRPLVLDLTPQPETQGDNALWGLFGQDPRSQRYSFATSLVMALRSQLNDKTGLVVVAPNEKDGAPLVFLEAVVDLLPYIEFARPMGGLDDLLSGLKVLKPTPAPVYSWVTLHESIEQHMTLNQLGLIMDMMKAVGHELRIVPSTMTEQQAAHEYLTA